jgi:polyisoprenoid-binding protein YceI
MAYQIDTSHSSVEFSVRHMMVSKARGSFDKWSGTVALNEANPAATTVDITLDAASINTKDEKRDGHLKSADFFDVEKFPTLHFKSTKVEVAADKKTAKLTGDLTIRDVTKPAVLNVEYQGSAKSPWGTTSYGFSASTKINREDWGLNWNAALETGGWLVGKDIQIDIELELVQVADQEKAAA